MQGCEPSQKVRPAPEAVAGRPGVPNLHTYVDSLVEVLSRTHARVPRLTQTDTRQTRDTATVDWAEVLRPLRDCAIHLPGQKDDFTTRIIPDTTLPGLHTVYYTSVNPKQAIRHVWFGYDAGGRLVAVSASRSTENSLFHSDWDYAIDTRTSFFIDGVQRLRTGEPTRYHVELFL